MINPTNNSSIRIPHSALIALGICLCYFAFLIYFSRQHNFGTYATETDFYHLYAPDAARIAAGQFPQNDFQGPGYPVLLSLVTKFTGDLFISGKWISIVSAVLCAWLAFVLFKRLFGDAVGIGAALLTLVGVEFPEFSLQATTDIFFLLLCLTAIVIFIGNYFSLPVRIILTAFFTGVAYLTRYNGLFLLGCFLLAITAINFFEKAWRDRWIFSAIFLLAFFLTVLPWLVASYRHYGSPFYNANYLNMATLFYPELAGGEVTQDGTRKAREMFHSFGEVIRYNPQQAFRKYFENLGFIFLHLLRPPLVSQLVGWIGLAGFVLALIERKSKGVILLLLTIASYFLLMGLNHWEERYFFFIGVCSAGLAAYFIFRIFEWISEKGWLPKNYSLAKLALPGLILLLIWAQSFTYAQNSFRDFLKSHPQEIPSAAKFLRSTNAAPQSLKILARKPHLPFMAKQIWVFFPPVKSLDELKEWLKKNPVDYIAIGKRELKSRKELAALGDPKTAPDWLQAAWKIDDPPFILYKPKL